MNKNRIDVDNGASSAVSDESGQQGCAKRLWDSSRVRISEAAVASAGHSALDLDAVRARTRGRADHARLRQIVMYLAHVGLGASLTATGLGLGRDRTTVRHGCRLVEDKRVSAEDDQILTVLEWGLRAQLGVLCALAEGNRESRHD